MTIFVGERGLFVEVPTTAKQGSHLDQKQNHCGVKKRNESGPNSNQTSRQQHLTGESPNAIILLHLNAIAIE